MATANIGLQFTADKGLPTLQQVLSMLKEIKEESGKGISIKVNHSEVIKAQKEVVQSKEKEVQVDNQLKMNVRAKYDLYKEESKFAQDRLKSIKDEISILESKYKRQDITQKELNKGYGQAIASLKQIENQEKLIEQLETKIWEIKKKGYTEIDNQRVATKKLADDVAKKDKAELEAMAKKISMVDKIRNSIPQATTSNFSSSIINSLTGVTKSKGQQENQAYWRDMEDKPLKAEVEAKTRSVASGFLSGAESRAIQTNYSNLEKFKTYLMRKGVLDRYAEELKGLQNSQNTDKKAVESFKNRVNQELDYERKKNADMDKLHSQALKQNQIRDAQKATGFSSQTNIGLGGMFDIYLLRQGINVINSAFKPLVEYEQAIYNLGVVAEKTEGDISSLFNKFQQLSTEIPVSAISLVKATDEITRVGLSYEDAYAVATQGAKLAIASGDKIEGVTDSLAKVIVGLEMFGRTEEEVARLTDQMQSVILKTPLSTQTLSEGLRHATSAMAVFVQNSTKSGKDLEDYKDKMLQTTLALEGGFARLGKILPLILVII